MRILKEHTAGLVIDIQERLLPHIYGYEEVLKNTVTLIKGLQLLDVPILVTQQYTHGLGQTVEEITSLFDPFRYIEKISFSCCDEPSFCEQVNILQKKFILIAGIETHVCVLQTAIDLVAKGYVPVIVQDCVSSRKANDKEQSVRRLAAEGAIITTAESVLFELTRLAGNDLFKSISKLVK